MNRLSLFKKLMLTLIGIGAVGSLIEAGTFANFQATASQTGNTFSAGTLQITETGCNNSPGIALTCATAIINTTGAKPGDMATGTVTLTNSGTLAGNYSVYFNNVTGTAGIGGSTLLNALNVTVHDDTANTCVYGKAGAPVAGACNALTTTTATTAANAALASVPQSGSAASDGSWTAGTGHTFTIVVQFPTSSSTIDNAYQGGSVSFDIVFAGTT